MQNRSYRQLMVPVGLIWGVLGLVLFAAGCTDTAEWWRDSGRYTTSERGAESATPHLRGISDKNGRLLVLMSHNTDIADGWERENDDFDFFDKFSFPAYAIGINVGVYVMSH